MTGEPAWVEVYSAPQGTPAPAVEALRKAGVPSRIEAGSPRTRGWLRHRNLLDPDRLAVPPQHVGAARRLLVGFEAAEDARIEPQVSRAGRRLLLFSAGVLLLALGPGAVGGTPGIVMASVGGLVVLAVLITGIVQDR